MCSNYLLGRGDESSKSVHAVKCSWFSLSFFLIGSSSSPNVSSNGKGKRKKKLTVEQVFNQDEDGGDAGPKKRKLIPIEYSEEEMKAVSNVTKETKPVSNVAEEKRKSIKSLIEKIPTEKKELFAYQLDWSVVDNVSEALSKYC